MADIKLYFPKVLKYEGGFANDPNDHGGATNIGVTLSTFQSVGYDNNHDGHIDIEDLKLLTTDEAMAICKKGYWDSWKADFINNQSIAETLVEWIWGSGRWGIIIPQRLLGVPDDGLVGQHTLDAINGANQKWLHEKIRLAKLDFIANLIKTHPDQEKFRDGWIRRINEYVFID
jgi:lysozyme family protein